VALFHGYGKRQCLWEMRGNNSLPTNIARSDTGTEFDTPKYIRGADGSWDSSVSIVTRLQAEKLKELNSTSNSGR
jgi:hypothetical protein